LLPSNLVPGSAEYNQAQANLLALSQIVGVLGAAASGGDVGVGAAVAANATQYNFLGDHAEAKRDQAREEFKETNGIGAARQLVELEGADQRSDNLLAKYRLDKSSLSAMELAELNAYVQVYTYDMALKYGEDVARTLANALVQNGPDSVGIYPYAGTTDAKNAFADALRAQAGGLFDQLAWVRPKSENDQIYTDAQGYLRINNEQQGLSNLGNPALYGLTGSLGAGIRIAAAANGVLQAGYGVDQAFNGDLWNAVGNIVVGALGVASVRIPSTRLPNASGVGELPVTNPSPGSTLVKEAGEVFDKTSLVAKGTGGATGLTGVTQKQLDKKFKHASDFGVVTTKKNSQTLAQYETAIKTHMASPSTVQQGTYGFVKDSKVFFNSATNNAVVLDNAGNFVTGFKLAPGTQQFDNFIKNGVLR
ncbi:colicin D domain-containing protein, partial [Pseudomonas sp. AL03]|uniref:colicin D domain-containing protein n=1 Tax=Pseudomonas sp. AL03 TaxID=3042230 RepID=UPI00249A95F2